MAIIKPGDPIWIKGKAYPSQSIRYTGEDGHELDQLAWIDTDTQMFGQYVLDEEGHKQLDPDDPCKPWQIVRYGCVRMEPRG